MSDSAASWMRAVPFTVKGLVAFSVLVLIACGSDGNAGFSDSDAGKTGVGGEQGGASGTSGTTSGGASPNAGANSGAGRPSTAGGSAGMHSGGAAGTGVGGADAGRNSGGAAGTAVGGVDAGVGGVGGIGGTRGGHTGQAGRGNAGSPGVGGEGTAKVCGGFAGPTCSETEYCAYMPGQYCGAADASALCRPRPEACTGEYAPVCGCDGKTYSNSCIAAGAGTGVHTEGECDSR